MLRLPYKLLALTCAALLFCTGCQFHMGYPDETYPDGTASTVGVPDNSDPIATTTPKGTSATTTQTTPEKPNTTENAPVTTKPNVPITEEPAVPKKRVAFTFDDGPHTTLTYKFVDKLKEYGASATFFVVGNRLSKSGGAAISYAYENGCEIGIHSYTHEATLYYDRCTEAEYFSDMQQTADAINLYIPTTVTLMRPPGGNITEERIKNCPYAVITWSVDSLDWKYNSRSDEATIEENVNTIVDNVMKDISEGDIVLMHELYQNSYEAFCIIIERLYAEGYEIVSVSELLGDSLQPGVKYRNG